MEDLEGEKAREATLLEELKLFADCDPDMLKERGEPSPRAGTSNALTPRAILYYPHLTPAPPFSQTEEKTRTAQEAANRWTDNVFCIRTWAQRKMNCVLSELDKAFGIPTDLDYLE
jgi:hypothetical protein